MLSRHEFRLPRRLGGSRPRRPTDRRRSARGRDFRRVVAGKTIATSGALRAFDPWIDQVDHHGYALVTASRSRFDCTLRRVQRIKQRSRKLLGADGDAYRPARGQTSIKGVNGPPAP